MTPHSASHRVPASLCRRSATFLVAVMVMVGVPLVAQAIDDEPMFDTVVAESVTGPNTADRASPAALPSIVAADRELAADAPAATPSVEELAARIEPTSPIEPASPDGIEPATDPALDAAIAVLSDSYEWDEHSLRVGALQQLVGLRADGWYGQATHRAHTAAMAFAGLPTSTLPIPILPPGPSPEQWAAMRECEAGGDYTITNPSGKYRGAYQFDRSTWNSVAERNAPDLVGVDPAAASPADQDAMALALYRERGARPWPHCGRHLR